MDIHELRCFAQAAKDGSYSVAAEKLCISQPALSKIIQRMEGYQALLHLSTQATADGRGRGIFKESGAGHQ